MTVAVSEATPSQSEAAHVIVRGNAAAFVQEVVSGRHQFKVDEPLSLGGTDTAPDPYDYLLAALGACTSMTIGLYARRNHWPLETITVALNHSRIHAKDCSDCMTKEGILDQIDLAVSLTGALNAEQRATLMQAASRCPVHRTLRSEIKINVQSAGPAL